MLGGWHLQSQLVEYYYLHLVEYQGVKETKVEMLAHVCCYVGCPRVIHFTFLDPHCWAHLQNMLLAEITDWSDSLPLLGPSFSIPCLNLLVCAIAWFWAYCHYFLFSASPTKDLVAHSSRIALLPPNYSGSLLTYFNDLECIMSSLEWWFITGFVFVLEMEKLWAFS